MAIRNLDELKQSYVSEIRKRVTDKILEQSNADLLIKLINQAETETEAMNIAALGTTYKRTGFHFDKRLEKISNNIKYKAKNDRLSFVNDENRPTHELIIGDNYDALQNLLITHKGKIDVIYIDPPYGKDNMGDFAKTNYNNSITRDNLLSMLYPRLLMAKRLLTPEGVIFCSIDDKNQAYVKCLFDEVFGEDNFVATAPRKTGAGSAATRSDSALRVMHDYVLIYRKSKESVLKKKIVGEKEYEFCDKYGKFMLGQFQASGSDATRKARPKLWYPIYVTEDVELTSNEPASYIKVIYPEKVNDEDGRWMWKKETFESDKDKYIYFDGDRISRKIYYDENKDQTIYQVEKAYFDESSFRNANGTNLLGNIIGKKSVFANPKPIDLIKHIIDLHPNNKSIILDFFAGSGTTGQAVMELNKEDGGNRTFILCTNNEITDKTPNGIAYDVTTKRLKRVMSGECYDGTNDFPWLEDHEPYCDNLNVYEIETVSKTEYRVGETAFDKIDETCYGLPKFEKLTDKIEWVCKNFENATKMEGVKSC